MVLDASVVHEYFAKQKDQQNSRQNVSIIPLCSDEDDSVIFVSEEVAPKVKHSANDDLEKNARENSTNSVICKQSGSNKNDVIDVSLGDFSISYNESWVNHELEELKKNGELTATMEELAKFL